MTHSTDSSADRTSSSINAPEPFQTSEQVKRKNLITGLIILSIILLFMTIPMWVRIYG